MGDPLPANHCSNNVVPAVTELPAALESMRADPPIDNTMAVINTTTPIRRARPQSYPGRQGDADDRRPGLYGRSRPPARERRRKVPPRPPARLQRDRRPRHVDVLACAEASDERQRADRDHARGRLVGGTYRLAG